MSTTQAMAFRRSQLPQAREDFKEMLRRPGVYILLGADDGPADQREAYIGESEDVYARIARHAAPKGGQEFWEDAIVLVSKDENLTKSHARYLESKLIALAKSNPRWNLPNRQEPDGDAGRLPMADRFDMNRFAEEAKILVGVLGCDIFRPMRVPGGDEAMEDQPTFQIEGPAFKARMRVGPSGLFIVMAGSQARLDEVPSVPVGTKRLRKTMCKAGDLRAEGGNLVFSKDYGFKSVSSAAGVVRGASVSGRREWRDADGQSYGAWEAARSAADGTDAAGEQDDANG